MGAISIFTRVRTAVKLAGAALQGKGETILTLADATGWLDGLSSASETVTPQNALHSSPVAAAHRVLTNSIGNLPIKVFQKKGAARLEVDHNLNYVLNVRSNAHMTPFILKKTAMSQCLFYGTSFIFPVKDHAGRTLELLPLPSSSAQGWRDAQGDIWYSFTTGDGSTRKFRSDELIIFHWDTRDGLTGIGLLDIARDAISVDKAAQKYAGKFYKNGARISGVVEVASQVSEESKEIIRQKFERMTSGMDNAFRTAVLDLGMKYTPLGINQKDAQFVESRNFTVEEISRFTGVPLYKMQSGKQSYQSNEQQGLDYVIGVLQPIATQWEQELTYKLLNDRELRAGHYLRFNLAAEMRADDQTRSLFYEKMIGIGTYCIDDCRATEDKDPLPNGWGQEFWMSKNYDTIKNIIEGGEKQ